MPGEQDDLPEDTGAPSDGPIEGSVAEEVDVDDPRKAEKLTAPSVDGHVGEAEE